MRKSNSELSVLTRLALGGALLTLLACGGCGSLISGHVQQVSFDSNPTKADVYVNGTKVGVTPCVAIVPRNKMLPKVEFKKDGYETVNIPVTSRLNYIVFLDCFLWFPGLTSLTYELNSDTSVEYDPNRYFIMLEPIKGAEAENTVAVAKAPAVKEAENTKEQSKIIRYIAVNHDQLVSDIAQGTGEHLSALFELLGVLKEKQAEALGKLKDLYVKYADTMEFARAVDITFPR